MIGATRILLEAGAAWTGRALPLIALSIVWSALSATVVLFPLATAALYVGARRVVLGSPVRPRAVLADAQRYLWRSAEWALVNALIAGALYALTRWEPVAGELPGGVKLAAEFLFALWAPLRLYSFPLLLEQPARGALRAERSTWLLTLTAPVLTLGLAIVAVIVAALTWQMPLPLLAVAPGFLALLGYQAVADRLAAVGLPLAPEL